jgi:hypothetical protein
VPPKDGEKKVPLNMRIAPDVQDRLEKLQQLRGATSLSEAATDAMVAGLEELEEAAYSSGNQRFINERLKAKRDGAVEAVIRLEALARAIESLDVGGMDNVDASEAWDIAAKFRAWLKE